MALESSQLLLDHYARGITLTPFPETRASLLLRIRNPRDQSAWAVFLQIYQPLIYRLARRRGVQDADAREVTQDVLMAVAGAINRWEVDPGRGSFRGWLATITRNIVVNYLVRQSRFPRAIGTAEFQSWLEEQPDPASEELDLFDREEQHQMFLWAVDQIRSEFHETTWRAFWQTTVEGRQAAIVASELKVNVGVVYVSRSRVMKRLRDCVLANARNGFFPKE